MAAPIIATNSEELIAQLRKRRNRLGLSQLAVDEKSGMHLGYCGKVERPDGRTKKGKKWGRRITLGPIFDAWIQSLGVGVVIVPLAPAGRRRHPDPRQLCFDFLSDHAYPVSQGDTDGKRKVSCRDPLAGFDANQARTRELRGA